MLIPKIYTEYSKLQSLFHASLCFFHKIFMIYTKNNILCTIGKLIYTLIFLCQMFLISKSIEQIKEVNKFISVFQNQTLNFSKLSLLYEISKVN